MADGEKGNLGRSAPAGKATEWLLLWSITNALQNTSEVYWKSQVPLADAPPHQWKWPTLSRPTWLGAESHFQKSQGRRLGRMNATQSERWVGAPTILLTHFTHTHTHRFYCQYAIVSELIFLYFLLWNTKIAALLETFWASNSQYQIIIYELDGLA